MAHGAIRFVLTLAEIEIVGRGLFCGVSGYSGTYDQYRTQRGRG
jgi:hypothetical protein